MWVKRGEYRSVSEYIAATTNNSVAELRNPEPGSPLDICGMAEAAALIRKEIDQMSKVTIIGDYDSDGLNATAILVRLFRYLGVEPKTVIPRRISDGYGLSANIVNGIDGGLVITIDNGIVAVNEVQMLKDKGCRVIVIDHHLPGDQLPPADVLVDPHIDPSRNKFCGYCGAGLGYLLAMLILESEDPAGMMVPLRQNITVHAAIATVTDVMPMLGPNRRIVMDGLAILNGDMRCLSPGLIVLRNCTGTERYTESDLGFTLGPLINATARLYDRGGESVLKALICDSAEEARGYVAKMVQINDRRKELTKQYVSRIEQKIQAEGLAEVSPIVVVDDGIPEGLIGLVAGNLVNKYGTATFVLSRAKDMPGLLKGSGRANTEAGEDLTSVLDAIRPLCAKCGGHAGAAGLSLYEADLPRISQIMRESFTAAKADVRRYYDLEIAEADIPQVYQELMSFAPFGPGLPEPVILVRGYHTVERFGSHYRVIGKMRDSIRINGIQSDIFGYQMAAQYTQIGCPGVFDIVGTVAGNTYNGRTTIQIRPLDLLPVVA